ncbi:hypothetical protein XH92_08120 [Bradyrhizobium sp. CCBAU 53421]|nr:hypothetical protein XH92_08120 [Bradyrhizobium sp. CCBAU 53421]
MFRLTVYVGVEIHFRTGNKNSAALQLDGAVFDDPAWVEHSNSYWDTRKSSDLEWLNLTKQLMSRT